MTRSLRLAALLAVAALVHAAAATPAPPDSGLRVAPASLELGTIAADTAARRTVWLINAADHSVVVTKATAACGCTTVHAEFPLTLEPGQARAVPIEVTAPRTSGTTRTPTIRFETTWGGPTKLEMTLASGSPAATEETVADDVPADLVFVPVRDRLGAVDAGSTIDTMAWIVNASSVERTITDVRAGCGCTTIVGARLRTLAPGLAMQVPLRISTTKVGEKSIALRTTDGTGAVATTRVTLSVTAAADEQAAR